MSDDVRRAAYSMVAGLVDGWLDENAYLKGGAGNELASEMARIRNAMELAANPSSPPVRPSEAAAAAVHTLNAAIAAHTNGADK